MHLFHTIGGKTKLAATPSESIPWHHFEKLQLNEQQAELIKNDALAVWTALPLTEKLLREQNYDGEFASFLSAWFEKEKKHAELLLEYLQRFWPVLLPSDKELNTISADCALVPSLESIMLHFCREIRLMQWFKTSARWQSEAVIKKIYRVIAADEARHAATYLAYMKQAVSHYGDEARIAFSKGAALMLNRMKMSQVFPPAGLHFQAGFYPSGIIQQGQSAEDMRLVGENMLLSLGFDWEQKAMNAILNNTSHLLGEDFTDEQALNQYRKTRIAASYNQAGFY